MREVFKILAWLSGISIGIVILFVIRIDRHTNKLRKNIKTGDRVRFYVGETGQAGIVEKVYYVSGIKTVKIHGIEGFTERPVSEIYLSF